MFKSIPWLFVSFMCIYASSFANGSEDDEDGLNQVLEHFAVGSVNPKYELFIRVFSVVKRLLKCLGLGALFTATFSVAAFFSFFIVGYLYATVVEELDPLKIANGCYVTGGCYKYDS